MPRSGGGGKDGGHGELVDELAVDEEALGAAAFDRETHALVEADGAGVVARLAAGSPTRSRELGGGVGGLRGGGVGGLRGGLAGGHGLADPAADAVDELLAAGRLGVTHIRYEPEVLRFPGRHV
jgi:hypothetical protein